MKRAVLVVAALVCVMARPASVYAQSDFIDWLEGFSGPGPFHTYYRCPSVYVSSADSTKGTDIV